MRCCFCGKEIEIRKANNAAPLKEGYCCENCNAKVVLPFRTFLSTHDRKDTALWIKQDQLELVKPQGEYFTLEELQKAVNGYIELAPVVDEDYLTVVNEEGLLKGLPLNTLYLQLFGRRLVGNVLIVPRRIFESPEED